MNDGGWALLVGAWLSFAVGQEAHERWAGRVHDGEVLSLAFSPDARTLASAGPNGAIRLTEVASGKARALLRAKHRPRYWLAFSPDGRKLASLDWEKVTFWDIATRRARSRGCWGARAAKDRQIIALGIGVSVLAVRFRSEGLETTGSWDHAVRLWNSRTRRLLATLRGHEGDIHDIAVSRGGRLLASASYDGTVRVWNARTGTGRVILRQTGPVMSVALSPDGKWLAAGDEEGMVRVWSLDSGTPVPKP